MVDKVSSVLFGFEKTTLLQEREGGRDRGGGREEEREGGRE